MANGTILSLDIQEAAIIKANTANDAHRPRVLSRQPQ